jgi:riboflavin kinase/FMN adenylyltransferase
MKIFRGVPAPEQRVATALTIGNFDGVHRGHQALLAQVVAAAKALDITPAVLTFEPHPREFFTPDNAPARVANLRDKAASLAASGIERLFVLHFNRRLASMSAESFIDDVLVRGCLARWLAVGDDFRFGSRRSGDVALLRARAPAAGFEVAQLATVTEGNERISSSAVRGALLVGDLLLAQRLLGRPYSITGRVLHGAKLGRKIGFPTLNLRIEHKRPAVHGVFAVRVHGIDDHAAWPGVASVGLRPTVDHSGRWLLEVHLFDFAKSVYGRMVRVEFVQRLRDEEKYGTLDQLTEAIRNDAARARALFGGVAAS